MSKINTFFLTILIMMAGCGGGRKSENEASSEYRVVVAKLFNRLNANDLQYRVEIAQRLGANQFLIFSDQVLREGAAEVLTNSGIDLWLIAPIFYHDDNQGTAEPSLAQLAEFGREPLWAVCDNGLEAWHTNQSGSGNWLRMVCPNDIEYLDFRINSFKPALRASHFTGISLDFIRYFTFWEQNYTNAQYTTPDGLRNSCFCATCVNEFANTLSGDDKTALEWIISGTVEIADFIKANKINRWAAYKCGKIDKTVEYILAELRKEFPHLKSNIHAVPYTTTDHNGAIKSIFGQDFALLSRRIDYISPMTYHIMCERPAQWINDVTADIVNVVNGRVPVVPTIQGATSATVTDIAFEEALINAIKPPSSGVVIWQFERLTETRLDIIDRVLNNK
jgi:hypothetical protein